MLAREISWALFGITANNSDYRNDEGGGDIHIAFSMDSPVRVYVDGEEVARFAQRHNGNREAALTLASDLIERGLLLPNTIDHFLLRMSAEELLAAVDGGVLAVENPSGVDMAEIRRNIGSLRCWDRSNTNRPAPSGLVFLFTGYQARELITAYAQS